MYRRDEKSSGFEVLVLVPATNLKASFSHFVYSFLVMNWQVRAKERVTRARAKEMAMMEKARAIVEKARAIVEKEKASSTRKITKITTSCSWCWYRCCWNRTRSPRVEQVVPGRCVVCLFELASFVCFLCAAVRRRNSRAFSKLVVTKDPGVLEYIIL